MNVETNVVNADDDPGTSDEIATSGLNYTPIVLFGMLLIGVVVYLWYLTRRTPEQSIASTTDNPVSVQTTVSHRTYCAIISNVLSKTGPFIILLWFGALFALYMGLITDSIQIQAYLYVLFFVVFSLLVYRVVLVSITPVNTNGYEAQINTPIDESPHTPDTLEIADDDKDDTQPRGRCVVCQDDIATHMFSKCAHLCVCNGCISEYKNSIGDVCPVCMNRSSTQSVFIT